MNGIMCVYAKQIRNIPALTLVLLNE